MTSLSRSPQLSPQSAPPVARAALALALAFCSCGPGTIMMNEGSAPDSAEAELNCHRRPWRCTWRDAGSTIVVDAGVVAAVDAGTSTPVVDAGTTTPVVDAGTATPPKDAGTVTPVVDAGSTGGGSHERPYEADSPWNTPIPQNPTLDANSSKYMQAIADNNLPITSDCDQYALPIYLFDDSTPRQAVQLREGYWQSYDQGDDIRGAHGYEPVIQNVPIPPDAAQSAGSDGQIIFWNPATGEQWEFWQWRNGQSTDPNGIDAETGRSNYTTLPGLHVATNAIRYHTKDLTRTYKYRGRLNGGGGGRGAGTPYLAGTIRPWEMAQGRIDHALAFAYAYPASGHVYPATKSDGAGVTGVDVPEGARLQLDPSITDAQMTAWGLSANAKIIARAMQTYGMYVIDNSGSSKIYLEDRLTAKWDASYTRDLVSKIPWSAFRVVAPPTAP